MKERIFISLRLSTPSQSTDYCPLVMRNSSAASGRELGIRESYHQDC
jgi:hypothetical protein